MSAATTTRAMERLPMRVRGRCPHCSGRITHRGLVDGREVMRGCVWAVMRWIAAWR